MVLFFLVYFFDSDMLCFFSLVKNVLIVSVKSVGQKCLLNALIVNVNV